MCCRAGLSGAGLTDFADDVADLVAATSGDRPGGSLAALYGKKQLSQQYGADLATQQNKVGWGSMLRVYYTVLAARCYCVHPTEQNHFAAISFIWNVDFGWPQTCMVRSCSIVAFTVNRLHPG